MISIKNAARFPTGTPLTSDNLVESHAARLILLLSICGDKEGKSTLRKIDGLTKLAKLDFFVRYPEFFARAASAIGKSTNIASTDKEPKMIRYHYGPWDHRYYQVLPFMEAHALVDIVKDDKKNQYKFYLTELGVELATSLQDKPEFADLITKMKEVKRVLGRKNGNQLKKLVYELFQDEVGALSLGEVIE
ncbi:MAG: hypothetical protein CL608_04655 [Anaerolineaceae bacterium]|nr:hypothetical protein [Anaerolineaceae bacterium]